MYIVYQKHILESILWKQVKQLLMFVGIYSM